MNQRFSPGQTVEYLLPDQDLPYIALNNPTLNEPESTSLRRSAQQDSIPCALPMSHATEKPRHAIQPGQAVPTAPRVFRTYTRLQLASLQPGLPPTEFGSLMAHSYSPNGGWYVMVVPDAYQVPGSGHGATHYSPYSYDRHVPLGFYGSVFTPGTFYGRVQPVDIAATLADLLGVNQPSASIGHILTQAIHPEVEVKPRREDCGQDIRAAPPPYRGGTGVPLHQRPSQPTILHFTRACRCSHSKSTGIAWFTTVTAYLKPDFRVKFCEIDFRNPVIAASGTFGYGVEFEDIVSLKTIGGFVTKGLSSEPMAGNTPPRLLETPSGMLNAIGLQNIGVSAFVEQKLAAVQTLPCPAIANIFGRCLDYCAVIQALNEVEGIAAYEINASCPNTQHGGMVFGTNASGLHELVVRAKSIARRPLIVKLSPNVTSIAEMARAAADAGADALSLVNTFLGVSIDARTRRPRLANITGGLSGPAIKPLALRMV